MTDERDETESGHGAARDLRMLMYSHKALRDGYLSLIPYVGFVFGPKAFESYIRSRLESGMRDNPVRWHATAGGGPGRDWFSRVGRLDRVDFLQVRHSGVRVAE